MRKTHDQYFMDMVRVVCERSTCLRRSVGCVLVNSRNHVLATGYNGVAAGMPHCNEAVDVLCQALGDGVTVKQEYLHACPAAKAASGTRLDECEAIHAEQNALLQCGDVWEIDTCYVTDSPCMHCMKLLSNTSCRRIIYAKEYSQKALEYWEKRGKIHARV